MRCIVVVIERYSHDIVTRTTPPCGRDGRRAPAREYALPLLSNLSAAAPGCRTRWQHTFIWGTGDVDMWGIGVGENRLKKQKSFLAKSFSHLGLFQKEKAFAQKPIEKEKSLLKQYYVPQTKVKESFSGLIDEQAEKLKTRLKETEFINLGDPKDKSIDPHVERAKKSDAVRRFVKESKDLQRRDPTFFLEPSRFVRCVSPCGPTEESRYKCKILAQVLFRVRASEAFDALLRIFQKAFVEKLSKRQ